MYSVKVKKIKLPIAGLLSMLLLLNSCVQSDQEIFLNPDGSGMADIKVTMENINIQAGGKEDGASDGYQEAYRKYSNEKSTIKKVNSFIRESKGIDAWEEVDYTISEEGKLTITARVYFKDISQYQLKEIPMLRPVAFNEEEIRFRFDNEEKSQEPVGSVQETMEKVRKDFEKSAPAMAAVGATAYSDQIFHLPYKVKKNPYFSKGDNYTASFQLNFSDMIGEMRKVVEDDERLREAVEEQGVSGMEDPAWEQVLYPKGLELEFKTGLFSGDPQTYVDVEEKIASIADPQPQFSLPKPPTPPVSTQMPERAISGSTSAKQLAVLGEGYFDMQGPLMVSLEDGLLSVARMDDATFGKAFELEKPEGMYEHFIRISPDKSRLLVSYIQTPPNPQSLLKMISLEDGRELNSKTIKGEIVNDAVWVKDTRLALIKGDDLTFANVAEGAGMAFTEPATDLEAGREQSSFLAKLGVRQAEGKPLLYCSTGDKLLMVDPAKGGGLVEELSIPAIPGKKYRTPVQMLVHDSTGTIVTADYQNLYIYYPEKKSWETLEGLNFGHFPRASWNPDGTKLVYLKNGKNLMVMDVEQSVHKELKEFEGNRWLPNEVYWSPDGKYLLTRSSARVLTELIYP